MGLGSNIISQKMIDIQNKMKMKWKARPDFCVGICKHCYSAYKSNKATEAHEEILEDLKTIEDSICSRYGNEFTQEKMLEKANVINKGKGRKTIRCRRVALCKEI